MKNIALLFGMLFLSFSSNGQSWEWLHSSTSQGGNMISQGLAEDAQGNVFNIGLQYMSATFGTIPVNSTQPFFCLFLSKQDANGNYEFAQKIWADAGIKNAVLQLDQSGNVYIFGTCNGYWLRCGTTDSIPFSTSLSATDQTKFFLIKYDNNGNLVWAKTGESNQMYANARATTRIGNSLYFGGDYFGNFNFLGMQHSSMNSNSSFILKVDTAGNGVWLNSSINDQYGGTFMTALTNDGSNLYACGKFQNGIQFDNILMPNNVSNAGGDRIYLFKFNANGQAVWGQQEGGVAHYGTTGQAGNNPNCIVYDGVGNIYIGGSYQDSLGNFQNMIQNPFVSKYNASNGVKAWTVKYPSEIDNSINGIVVDSTENPIVVGDYKGAMIVDTFNLYTSVYSKKGMILQLDKNSGNALSAASINEAPGRVTIGNIFMSPDKSHFLISGVYEASFSLGNDTVASNGYSIYTAKHAWSNQTSIATQLPPLKFHLFPNPTSDYLNFEFNSIENGMLTIVNSIGKTLYMQHFNAKKGTLDLSSFSSGIYYLILHTDKGNAVQSFVKR